MKLAIPQFCVTPRLAITAGMLLASVRSYADPDTRIQTLLAQTVALGEQTFQLRIEEEADSRTVRAHFLGKKKEFDFEFADPVGASAEIEMIPTSKELPPSVLVRISGGTDGDAYTFLYVLTSIEGKILLTFKADYRTDTYFLRAHCARWENRNVGEHYLIEQNDLLLTEAKLLWNEKLRKIQKQTSEPVTVRIKEQGTVIKYSRPSLRSRKLGKLKKGEDVILLSAVDCHEKNDGKLCSQEPAERSRWLKVEDAAKHRYWLREKSPLSTNLPCNVSIGDSDAE